MFAAFVGGGGVAVVVAAAAVAVAVAPGDYFWLAAVQSIKGQLLLLLLPQCPTAPSLFWQ